MIKDILSGLWTIAKQPLLIACLGAIGFLVVVPVITYLLFVGDLSSKQSIINKKYAGVELTDRNGKEFFTLYESKTKETVPLDEIPKTVQEAVIASEDKDFYKHKGFSISGIGRAILTDVKNEEFSSGGSTISQQLVKNTLLTQKKSLLRKYQEIFLALEVERRFSKDDILEMYLNTSYFGEGAYGIQDAAHAYFNKPASDLTLGESALLAAILPAPSALSPLSGDKDAAFAKQAIVLRLMEEQGYITSAERTAATNETIVFNPAHDLTEDSAPHFALMVKDELIKKYGEQRLSHSGFIVKTTIDLTNQQYAEKVVANQVTNLARNNVTNGAAVVLNPKTGEILALVGSHDWYDETNGKINMALSPRQPGSSFKPIIYGEALQEKEITPATQLDDKETTFPGGYTPNDYDRKYRGLVTVRTALANSLNIPAVLVMQKVGVQTGINFARNLGITSLNESTDYGYPLVLGAGEVPLIEMTSAYGVFATGGTLVPRTTILEITDQSNNVIYSYSPPTGEQVMDEGAAFQIASILSDNAARAPVFGNALTISRPAAVKTGTTEDYRDALTIGFTPSLVVGVWVGNNDNQAMDSIAGSLGAAPIWRQLMERFLAGTTVEQFRIPSKLLTQQVCRENGFLAKSATTSAIPEYFYPGTLPTQQCTFEAATPTPSPTTTETPTPTITQPAETPTSFPTPTSIIFPTNPPTPTPISVTVPAF